MSAGTAALWKYNSTEFFFPDFILLLHVALIDLLCHMMLRLKLFWWFMHACMCVCTPKPVYTWITASNRLVFYQLHTHMHMYMTNRVEDVGSVVCLCMRCVRRRKCSLMDSCTSVGMSGDVWLIFTAASRKPIEPMGSFTFSVAMVTGGCWGLGSRGGDWSGRCSGPQAGLRDGLGKWALVRQGTQQSFQETNVRRPNKARPQTTNTPSRRPEVASGGEPRGPETGGSHNMDKQMVITRVRQGKERERERQAIRTWFFKWPGAISVVFRLRLKTVSQVYWEMCFINIKVTSISLQFSRGIREAY